MFIVIDGLDGVGKGVNQAAAKKYFLGKGKRVFDLEELWKKFHRHPQFEEPLTKKGEQRVEFVNLDDIDVMMSAEPTYCGVGQAIRDEMVTAKKGTYSALETATAFSLDRLVLYRQVILPALGAGKIVVQSRSVSTSIAYQPMQAVEQSEALSVEEILKLPGNRLALEHAPDVLLVPTVHDFEELSRRIQGRSKDDRTWFEGVEFQRRLLPQYGKDGPVKEIFERAGSKVLYVDNGISIEESERQTIEVLKGLGV